jgi:hypothetical protein
LVKGVASSSVAVRTDGVDPTASAIAIAKEIGKFEPIEDGWVYHGDDWEKQTDKTLGLPQESVARIKRAKLYELQEEDQVRRVAAYVAIEQLAVDLPEKISVNAKHVLEEVANGKTAQEICRFFDGNSPLRYPKDSKKSEDNLNKRQIRAVWVAIHAAWEHTNYIYGALGNPLFDCLNATQEHMNKEGDNNGDGAGDYDLGYPGEDDSDADDLFREEG